MTTSMLYDAETGLPGRALLTDRLLMALRGAERTGHEVGLVLVGVQSIEDAAGNATPNEAEVFKEVADRLSACVRGLDSVGRVGPTTFALVLQGEVGEEGLRILAQRVLFELSSPVTIGLRPYFVMARLGGTIAIARLDDPMTMMSRAGQALAEAQRSDAGPFVLRAPEDQSGVADDATS